ncbi:MAG TPA: hypothetical protein DDX75_16730 [Phycisphaerales bacterium]|nr:hypothetical protein [Phycisphaerales bacterium]
MKKVWTLLVCLITAIIFNSISFAQTTTPPPETSTVGTIQPQSGFEQFRNWFHNPTDWLTMGADLRVRYTYGWNLDTLKSDTLNGRASKWAWYQNRTRLWQKFKLHDDVDFNIRYTWEFRVWDSPERKNGNGGAAEVRTHSTDFGEIVFDNFNLTVRNLGNMPLTMVAGRQDIMLGEGWLIADATPLDAARTAYFDALRFTYAIPGKDKTTLDLIYVENRASEDWALQPINNRGTVITQQDERAVIAYLTDKSNPNMTLEGYFILKNDNPIDYNPVAGFLSPAPNGRDRLPNSWSKKATIYTFGGALSGPLGKSEHWKYRTEAAIQTGTKQDQRGNRDMQNLMAFGTNNRLEYHFNDARKNRLRVGLEYLSGDDPGSNKNEAFDPLWGEWPRNSEILLYTYNLETMVGEVTNLYRLGFGHSIQLTEKLSMDTDYHLLWAAENSLKDVPNHPSGLGWSDSGKMRGQLGSLVFKYNVSKNLKTHLWLEAFQPGDYYASTSRDMVYFMRINMDYTF